MNCTKEFIEDGKYKKVKFSIEPDVADWKAALAKSYEKNKDKYQVSGFRKGRAPRGVVESVYGPVFLDDALDIILPDSYGKALEENKDVETVGRPDVKIVAISDATLKYDATVYLKPEVKLGAYTGLEFKRDKVKVTKEEVRAEIDKALDQAGSWEQITDAPAANGDRTIIDYSGSVDGVKFDGGTAEKQPLELGGGRFIPGFEEQVVGMKVGEEKDIEVTFPEAYGEQSLAGKKAVFAVKLHEIQRKSTPVYDDEFVKDVSEFDTVAKYEANIKETIKNKKEEEADVKLENAIVDKLCELAEADIPAPAIELKAEEMIEDFGYRLSYQGMKLEDYFKYTGQTYDDLKKNYLPAAEKNVRASLVLEAVMKEIRIPVSDEEIDAEIAEMAKKAGQAFDEYKKNFNEEYREYLRSELLNKKLFTYLKNNNTIQ